VKVAIFCVPGCTVAVRTLDYFKEKGLEISLVVFETAVRQKFSLAEQEFKVVHEKFRELIMKPTNGHNGDSKSLKKKLWLSIPPSLRTGVKKLLPQTVAARNDIVTQAVKRLNIRSEIIEKHSSQQTRDILERYGITYVLLGSSNWLIKEPLLSMKGTKVINAHCAKLPEHRSLDALPWSVMENDKVGLTTHFVDAGIDTGPILKFLEVEPQPGDNLISLRELVNSKIPELFWESITGLNDKTLTPVLQKEEEGAHHRPMTVEQLLRAEQLLQERIRRTGAK
jgi:folate-dependent phosphoribosylglycinamide formyltransferase PurN